MAEDQVRLLRHIESIAKKQGNNVCSECPERHPTWASLIKPAIKGGVKMGVFVCKECYKHHFKLGTSVCEVKSLTMATEWSEEEATILSTSGNKIVNSVYEAKNGWEDAKEIITFDRNQEAKLRYAYIENKYVQRSYFSRQDFDEIMTMLCPSYQQRMESQQNGTAAATTPPPPKNKVRRFSLTGGQNDNLNPDIRAAPRNQMNEHSAGIHATPRRSTKQQVGNARAMSMANPLGGSLHGTASTAPKGGLTIPETPRTARRRRGGAVRGHGNDIRSRQSGMLAAAPQIGLQDLDLVLDGSNTSSGNNNNHNSDDDPEMDNSSESLMDRSLRGVRSSMDSSMHQEDLHNRPRHNHDHNNNEDSLAGNESKNLMMLAMPSTLGLQPQRVGGGGGYGARRYSMGGAGRSSSDRNLANEHDNQRNSMREGRTCGGSMRGQRTLDGGSMRGQRTLDGGSMRGQRSMDGGSMRGDRTLDNSRRGGRTMELDNSRRGDRTLDNSRRGGRTVELDNSRRGRDRSESVTRRVRDGSLCRRRVDTSKRGERLLDSSPAKKNESILDTSRPMESSRRGTRTSGSRHRRTISPNDEKEEAPDMDWGACSMNNHSRGKKKEIVRRKTISTGFVDREEPLDTSSGGKSQRQKVKRCGTTGDMDRSDPSAIRRKGKKPPKDLDDDSGDSSGSRKSVSRKSSRSKHMDDGSGNSVSSRKSLSRKSSKSKTMDDGSRKSKKDLDGSGSSRKSISRSKSKSKGLDGSCSSVSSRKSLGRRSKSFNLDSSSNSNKSSKSKKVKKSNSSDKLKKRTSEPLKDTSSGRKSTKASRFRRIHSEGDYDSGSDSSDDEEVEKRSSAEIRTSKMVSKYSKNVPSSRRMMRSLSTSEIESEVETDDESDRESGRKMQRRHSDRSLGSSGSLGALDSDDSSLEDEDEKKPTRKASKKQDSTKKYKKMDHSVLASVATGGTLGALMTIDQPSKKDKAAATVAAVAAAATSERPKTPKKKQNPFRNSTGAMGLVALKESKKGSEIFDMKNMQNAMVSQWMTNTTPKSGTSPKKAETSYSMDDIKERILKGDSSTEPDESSSTMDKRKNGFRSSTGSALKASAAVDTRKKALRSSTGSYGDTTPLASMMAVRKKVTPVGKPPKRGKSTGSSGVKGKDFKDAGSGKMVARLVKA